MASPNTASFAGIETWIFDLDNTLYPAACNLFAQIDRRMMAYIADRLGIAEDEARRLQKAYYFEHGTTLSGLIRHHGVDPEDYLDYVHQIDLTPVPRDRRLGRALERLSGRKLVYTNGSEPHAERVLERLEVSHHFDGIFDIAAADYVPKPDPASFRRFIDRHGIDPKCALLADDIARNLVPAAALGMVTVWVRSTGEWAREGADGDHVHHVAEDLVSWLEDILEPGDGD